MAKDFDELLKEWKANISTGEAKTVREIVAETGRESDWVRERIREALTQGIMEATRKMALSMDGRKCIVPAYRWVKSKSKH